MYETIGDMIISAWLNEAKHLLIAQHIPSARLDSELILARAQEKTREFLLAHGEQALDASVEQQANTWLERRIKREPLAYIFGEKEFYGRIFKVTPATLIPRPESEEIITVAKELYEEKDCRIIDVGTGSGALAITLKKELPQATVDASDVSHEALEITRKNAEKLHADIGFFKSDLLKKFSRATFQKPLLIVANLPYVDPLWEVSPETAHEPSLALFANDHGLELINRLLAQAASMQRKDEYLILEADPRQHEAIVQNTHNYTLVEVHDFIIVLKRN